MFLLSSLKGEFKKKPLDTLLAYVRWYLEDNMTKSEFNKIRLRRDLWMVSVEEIDMVFRHEKLIKLWPDELDSYAVIFPKLYKYLKRKPFFL